MLFRSGIHYFWCQSPEPHGLQTFLLNENGAEYAVLATNFEKSLVDCLKRPTHCPPFYELVRLCRKSGYLPDIEKILKYASDCNVQALFNRLGFLFEKNLVHWKIQDDFFKYIENRMSRKQTDWPIVYDYNKNNKESIYLNKQKELSNFDASLMEAKNRWKVQFLQQN